MRTTGGRILRKKNHIAFHPVREKGTFIIDIKKEISSEPKGEGYRIRRRGNHSHQPAALRENISQKAFASRGSGSLRGA